MPIITVNLLPGRTDEQKENLIYEITQSCVKALDAPAENVRIIISEMAPQHYGVGGSSKARQAALSSEKL